MKPFKPLSPLRHFGIRRDTHSYNDEDVLHNEILIDTYTNGISDSQDYDKKELDKLVKKGDLTLIEQAPSGLYVYRISDKVKKRFDEDRNR